MHKSKLLLILFIFACFGAKAQTDSILRIKVSELETLFGNYAYNPLRFEDTSLAVIQSISKVSDLTYFPDRSVYLEKRAQQLENDKGVDFVGNYLENFNLDPVEDLEENISYRRRVQFGVQWDILDGGYFENQIRAQMLQDQMARERLSNNIARESQYYLKRFDQTVFVFNQLKLNLLYIRKSQLEKQHDLIKELVFLRKLKKEQLIKSEVRLAEIESLIRVYTSYNDYLGVEGENVHFFPGNLPLIDLNYPVVFEKMGMQTDSLLTANSNYKDYFKWYHQVGLRPIVRYNYFDIIADGNRSYFSGGLNLTVPLAFDTKLKNEVENEKWKYENERFTRDRANLHEEVLNTAHEFQYQMKRFIDAYQKRRLVTERLRVEKAKLRLNHLTSNPLDGLDLYDDLVETDINLIDLLQELYLKALKIHTKIPGVSIDEIIETRSVADLFTQIPERQKSVYIWSSTFEEYTGDFLSEYSIYNEFEKLVIAVHENDTLPEKKSLMNQVGSGTEVYFMLGNNKLFYHQDIKAYLSGILQDYNGINPTGIHLDIEPHTFPNWKGNEQKLLKEYVNFVTKVHDFCKKEGLKLELSVPKHYDPAIMDQLFAMADKIYFMCYENVKTDFLVRKLQPYVATNKDKVVIALRTEDFNNRLEMENKMEELQTKLEVNEFAYHDLKRIIAFDKGE